MTSRHTDQQQAADPIVYAPGACPGCAWPAHGTGPACADHRAAWRQDRREAAAVWVAVDVAREAREAAYRAAHAVRVDGLSR